MIAFMQLLANFFGCGQPSERVKMKKLIAANPRGEEFVSKAEAAHDAGDGKKARYWARKAIGLKP